MGLSLVAFGRIWSLTSFCLIHSIERFLLSGFTFVSFILTGMNCDPIHVTKQNVRILDSTELKGRRTGLLSSRGVGRKPIKITKTLIGANSRELG